jgi:ATP-dependent Lon protease
VVNPVILLDEIDKLSEVFKGDPTGVLLEILDPEQNTEFADHYLEVTFDFSKVLFIATANSLQNIERPLLDRLEVINLTGYTEEDKLEIAKRYLIKNQLETQGIPVDALKFSDEGLRTIIREYTRELGLRNLDRCLADVCRKTAKAIIDHKTLPIEVNLAIIREFLGKQKFLPDKIEEQHNVGVVTGLAWTQSGGDTLPVEVAVVRGRGRLTLTGQLGDVMQESAQAALSYIRSRSEALKIDEGFYRKYDIHIHVSEGAIPKDGPSAGIAMATAMVSALTGMPIKRDVAMTGEITLRGRVLPIGGLREKVMAALLAGIKTIVIPQANEKDLDDVPKQARSQLTFISVENMDEVLKVALAPQDQPLDLLPDDLAVTGTGDEAVVN